MAAKRSAVAPPPLETPGEDVVKALYSIGEVVLKSIDYLQSADGNYDGWIFFLQRVYSTMHYAMTGETL